MCAQRIKIDDARGEDVEYLFRKLWINDKWREWNDLMATSELFDTYHNTRTHTHKRVQHPTRFPLTLDTFHFGILFVGKFDEYIYIITNTPEICRPNQNVWQLHSSVHSIVPLNRQNETITAKRVKRPSQKTLKCIRCVHSMCITVWHKYKIH